MLVSIRSTHFGVVCSGEARLMQNVIADGPPERLWRGISDFDIGGDSGLQLGDGAMHAALDLLSDKSAKKRSI